MVTASELLHHIAQGRDIDVIRAGDHRLIRIREHWTSRGETYRVPLDRYDALMNAVVDALSKEHGKRWRIHIGLGHFGARVGEVRSGVFGHRCSRLRLAPRYLERLDTLIAPATEPA